MRFKVAVAVAALVLATLTGCAINSSIGSSVTYYSGPAPSDQVSQSSGSDASASGSASTTSSSSSSSQTSGQNASSNAASSAASSASSAKDDAKKIFKKLGIKTDFRDEFDHGEKPAKYQKYIVLHDTEGGGSPQGVIDSWDNSDNAIAAHFVIGRDGSVMQCVKLDRIGHHAGFGDTGHNELYGVEDESRDDKVGTESIGDWAQDYGMNSYSIGIELVHVGGEEDYPEVQLQALDAVIAYIDAYYGDNKKKSKIIDHKSWRTGNSDTSEEFAEFFKNYQGKNRTHDGEPWDISKIDEMVKGQPDEPADEPQDEPVDEPVDELVDEPVDEPVDEQWDE